jgi:hypothetical protein
LHRWVLGSQRVVRHLGKHKDAASGCWVPVGIAATMCLQ